MVLGAVQHISGVDELIAGSSNPQLSLCVAEHNLAPARKKQTPMSTQTMHQTSASGKRPSCLGLRHRYFASQANGVKSSLCLVLKIMFLVLISRMDGGCRGVAMAKRAS